MKLYRVQESLFKKWWELKPHMSMYLYIYVHLYVIISGDIKLWEETVTVVNMSELGGGR